MQIEKGRGTDRGAASAITGAPTGLSHARFRCLTIRLFIQSEISTPAKSRAKAATGVRERACSSPVRAEGQQVGPRGVLATPAVSALDRMLIFADLVVVRWSAVLLGITASEI